MDMKSLELIDKLCGCFETKMPENDEAAAEMVRVIKAISENRICILLSDGHIAPILKSSFNSESNLWKFVELQAA
jgi:hypothetical protein